MINSKQASCHVGMLCAVVLGGVVAGSALAEDGPTDQASILSGERPWQHDDGRITAYGRTYESWAAYITSDAFKAAGQRCGHAVDPALGEMAFLVDGPEDCSLSFNNPLQKYLPEEGGIYRIPVVFHVIRTDGGFIGHVPEELVHSQIDILNEDFRALSGSPGANGVDTRIEFYLAAIDPDGNPTNGITYTNNTLWHNDGGNYAAALSWDTSRYLNFYSTTAGGNLGYAFLPQQAAGSFFDRCVLLWTCVGRDAPIGPPYDQGRTGTHEVGHYLGLYHVFQSGCSEMDGATCQTGGDRICDTHPQQAPRFGCPDAPESCGSPDNNLNYMDYSDDLCYAEFTLEQAQRMRCVMEHYRPSLSDPIVPQNDDCTDALATFRGSTPIVTIGASDTSGIDAVCGDFSNDVWYRYLSGTVGELVVNVCLADFDAQVAVYAGCPTPGTINQLVGCETTGCGDGAIVTVDAEPLTTYWIRIGGANGSDGSAQMNVQFNPAPDCNGNGILDEDEISTLAASDCNLNEVPDDCELGELGQWVSGVDGFTSQFGPGDYSVQQVVGEPDVTVYGTSPNAWTAAQQNGSEETLTLAFNTAVYSTGIMIRETNGAGMITRVDVLDNDNTAETVWMDIDPSQPGVVTDFEIDWPMTNYLVRGVRLYIDTDATPGWEEIDAVRLYGFVHPDADDCNDNGVPDDCDAMSATGDDCNNNAILDSCEIMLSSTIDCDGNGIIDACELIAGAPDCNDNNVLDPCEEDCDGNAIPDECDLAMDPIPDCNVNGIPDDCDRADAGWWATDVLEFSSQFAEGDYAAGQILGEPSVNTYGDSPLAWSPANQNGSREFITVLYPEPVYANGAIVHETLGGGFVYRIDVLNINNVPHTVWVGDDPSVPGAYNETLFEWPQTPMLVWGLTVHVDTDATPGWEEIDAVRLRGGTNIEDCNGNGIQDDCDILFEVSADCNLNELPDECEPRAMEQWASSVVGFSSQFGEDQYSATRALLGPSVFAYGDSPDAWTPSVRDGSQEFLTVGFVRPVQAERVTVRQSWGAGSITRIDLIDLADQVHTVWQGSDPGTPGSTPVDFVAMFDRTDYFAKAVTVHINTDATTDWEEIDAIALYGYPEGATDLDLDGKPDDCVDLACPADCSPDHGDGTYGNGVVNIDDLQAVVDSFGANNGGPCDNSPDNGDGTFGDGTIGIDDLLGVINAFGACP